MLPRLEGKAGTYQVRSWGLVHTAAVSRILDRSGTDGLHDVQGRV